MKANASGDPQQALFEPAVRTWEKRATTTARADDNQDTMDYDLDREIREAEAKARAHPERCNVAYASVKGSFRR
jgi:hypothetical protein